MYSATLYINFEDVFCGVPSEKAKNDDSAIGRSNYNFILYCLYETFTVFNDYRVTYLTYLQTSKVVFQYIKKPRKLRSMAVNFEVRIPSMMKYRNAFCFNEARRLMGVAYNTCC